MATTRSFSLCIAATKPSMQLALTSWPHWGAVGGCPLKHIANLGSRHRVLGTFPAASTMQLSTAAPRGMVQGSMTRGSRAAFTISRLTSARPWPREYRSQVTWWKWKCASVKQSALLYTTATWLAASGMPLPWLAATWDCLVGWAFPRDCPDADACLTPGFPSRTPSARNSALSFPGRQAPRAKRTRQCRRHAMEFKDSMLKASGTGSPNRSRNQTHKIFHSSSSEEWIWLQTSATVTLSGATLPKSGSSGWGGEAGTTVDPLWDPCTPGHAPQTDPHEHSRGVALAEEQTQTGPCTAIRSRRPEHTRADGSTGHGQPSSRIRALTKVHRTQRILMMDTRGRTLWLRWPCFLVTRGNIRDLFQRSWRRLLRLTLKPGLSRLIPGLHRGPWQQVLLTRNRHRLRRLLTKKSLQGGLALLLSPLQRKRRILLCCSGLVPQ